MMFKGRGSSFMWRLLVLLTLWGMVPVAQSAATEQPTYSLAVVPQLPAADLERQWKPILKRLASETGVSFELRLYDSIPQFEAAFLAGAPDFVFMNPYHQVMAKREQGYIPLVRDGSAMLTGTLLVRRDSPIRSIHELEGKRVAFPAPNAFGASLYIRGLLGELYRVNVMPDYVGTHSKVIQSVLAGEIVAGGVANNMLKRESASLPDSPLLRDKLRVLYETPGFAPHPLSVHPRVAETLSSKVAKSMLDMRDDDDGRIMLEGIQMLRPVRANYARDYARLESFNLKKYLAPVPVEIKNTTK